MRFNNITLAVRVKGNPITEYSHNGQVFVEGRAGSAYEIELTNHNTFRVEAIVSVDGLSVLDGKDAGPASCGYLIEGGETLRIPGWKLTDSQVAAFEFGGKGQSYAGLSTGSTRNTGVIGLMAYREKARTYTYTRTRSFAPIYVSGSILGLGSDMAWTSDTYSTGRSRGIAPLGMNTCMADSLAMATASLQCSNTVATATIAGPKGDVGAQGPVGVQQVLGTGFGEAQDFATTQVAFERGDLHGVVALYYDEAQALRDRGIDLGRRTRRVRETPNPFPGAGCTPPAGWRG